MIFHQSLSDSKSPHVSRTLLSILADPKNAVVWTVSTSPFISKSSSPCTYHLMTVPRAPITFGIIVTFMFHIFFSSLSRSRYISLFSHSFNKVLNSSSSLFFVDYYKIWSSGWNLVIRLYLEIPEEFLGLIFSDRFWAVHILFVRMVKLQILVLFSVEHLSHPVVPSLILFLC